MKIYTTLNFARKGFGFTSKELLLNTLLKDFKEDINLMLNLKLKQDLEQEFNYLYSLNYKDQEEYIKKHWDYDIACLEIISE